MNSRALFFILLPILAIAVYSAVVGVQAFAKLTDPINPKPHFQNHPMQLRNAILIWL